MNILVAIDLSAASCKVIAAARRVAELAGATVHVVHVVHALEPTADFIGFEAGPEILRRQADEDHRQALDQLKHHVGTLQAAGIEAHAVLVEGPMAKTVLSAAERLGVEWIVVGSHGHGAVYDMLVGSHSAALLRQSPVPVLVVPTRDG